MNKFTENDCLPNFELKFKFLEHLRKPLTLESTRKRKTKNKTKQNGRERRAAREESQTTVLTKENQVSMPKNFKHLFWKTKPL